MIVDELKIGDRLRDYRRTRIYVITKIERWSGGNGEITYRVEPMHKGGVFVMGARHECKTFRQFERLKFVHREAAR